MDECIQNRQKTLIVHTDSGKQFTNKEFTRFLQRQGIEHSLGNANNKEENYNHHNQVHERFHRTLKGEIRKIIQDCFTLPRKPREVERINQLEEDQVATIVNQAVNNFNNLRSKARPAFGASPNIMENALLLFSKNKPVTEILGTTGTKKKEDRVQLKGKAIKQYAGDWVPFFVDWKKQLEERHQEALQQATERHQEALQQATERHQELLEQALENKEEVIGEVIKQKDIIAKQNLQLRQQLKLITEKVNALEEEMLRKAQAERLDKERKDRRRGRERRPSRAAATYIEYQEGMNGVTVLTRSPYVAARERVCLLFLYISGVRVSNCLKLTVFHLQQMLKGDSFVMSEIKSRQTRHLTLNINKSIYALILQRRDDIETSCQGKQGNDRVITGKGKDKPLHTSNLDAKLNQILQVASKALKKHLRTHSFRIGLTTSIIEVAGVEAAQKVIGHANLSTTAVYNRMSYKEKDFSQLMKKGEQFRRNKGIPRQYRKRRGKEGTP